MFVLCRLYLTIYPIKHSRNGTTERSMDKRRSAISGGVEGKQQWGVKGGGQGRDERYGVRGHSIQS